MTNPASTFTRDGVESTHWQDFAHGIAWGTVALFVFFVIAYSLMIAGVFTGTTPLPVATVLATVLLYLAFTVMHEAGHGNIAHEVKWMKPYERFMGWCVTVPFLFIPFGMFARIHDYHHAFTNDPERDPDYWVSGDNWRQASPRALTLILKYVYWVMTRFRKDPVIAQTHRSSFLYYTVTAGGAVTLVLLGFGAELLMVGVLPAFLVTYVLGMLFDWIPHTPSRQQGRYQNTRTYLFPGLNMLTLGQSYHHIHHLYPRVSWYHYHRVFKLVRPELEANNAPIETLFSKSSPGFGKSPHILEPGSADGIHKLTLKVASIQRLTADAVNICFENLNGKAPAFSAGQYVTVGKRIQGEDLARCYSICEPPSSNRLAIGVKQVDGGRMSGYLNRQLEVGDELTVAGPFGEFTYDPSMDTEIDSLVLIAGGSGITPVISILETALEQGRVSCVDLVYANRSADDVMFAERLEVLCRNHAGRFNLHLVYEHPAPGWDGESGRLDGEKLERMLRLEEAAKNRRVYVCGPEGMKDVVIGALQQAGVPERDVFVENFVQVTPEPEGDRFSVSIETASGEVRQYEVAENLTLLQAANQQEIEIPHACGTGQCGCCMMRLEEGMVNFVADDTPALLPVERADGMILACQCRPRSAIRARVS